jgi:dinuclear metal center YbgI/SA1388 family protein
MLVVHHGLYWGKVLLARGAHAARLRACFAAGLSLYAAHIPLDAHPTLGNNVALIEDAGFTPADWFVDYRGTRLGAIGTHAGGLSIDEICASLERSLHCRPNRIIGEYAGKKFTKAAAISGGAMRWVEDAACAGADIFITGEGSHSSYHAAVESGIVVLLYGHYMSEMIGLRRLREYCEEQFGLRCEVIDAPTGY